MTSKQLISFFLTLCFAPCFAQTFSNADSTRIALFPQQNELRNTLNISGIWRFKKDSLEVGERENWQNGLKNAWGR